MSSSKLLSASITEEKIMVQGVRRQAFRILMILAVTLSMIAPARQPAHAQGPLLTVGALALLGRDLSAQISRLIAQVDVTAQGLLANLDNRILGMVNAIEAKGERFLDLAISDVDGQVQGALRGFERLLNNAQTIISTTTNQIDTLVRAQIDNLANQIDAQRAAFENTAQHLITQGGVLGTYLMEQGAHYTIGLLALGIGLLGLVAIIASIVRAHGLPKGLVGGFVFALIVLFIVVSGAVLFVPDARAAAIQGLRGPSLAQRLDAVTTNAVIFRTDPRQIVLGGASSRELRVIGDDLEPNGERPSASIGNQPASVIASSNSEVVLDVGSLPPLPNSSNEVILSYLTATSRPSIVVQFTTPTPTTRPLTPADLVIDSFSISPGDPNIGTAVTASFTIINRGEAAAGSFRLQWKPIGNEQQGEILEIGGLQGNSVLEVNFPPYAYSIAGNFTSQAFVDLGNRIAEGNETNNGSSRGITVQPRVPQIVERRFFVVISSIQDPSSNTVFYRDQSAATECYLYLVLPTCIADGRIISTPLTLQPGDQISVRMLSCNPNGSGDPPINCITGGFGRPGYWGPDGVPNNFANMTFSGPLFSLGVRLGTQPAFFIGSSWDYQNNTNLATDVRFVVNDENFGDNGGQFRGTLEIRR